RPRQLPGPPGPSPLPLPVVGVAAEARSAVRAVEPRTEPTASSAQSQAGTRTRGTHPARGVATRSCPARGRVRAPTWGSTAPRRRRPRRSARRVCRRARGQRPAVDRPLSALLTTQANRPRLGSGPGTSRVYLRHSDRPRGSPPRALESGPFGGGAPGGWELNRPRGGGGVDPEGAGRRAPLPRLRRPGRPPPMGRLLRVVSKVGPAVGVWYLRERGRP